MEEYRRSIDKLIIFYWLGLENDDARFSSDDFWRETKMPLDTSRFVFGIFIVLVSLTARWLYAI